MGVSPAPRAAWGRRSARPDQVTANAHPATADTAKLATGAERNRRQHDSEQHPADDECAEGHGQPVLPVTGPPVAPAIALIAPITAYAIMNALKCNPSDQAPANAHPPPFVIAGWRTIV